MNPSVAIATMICVTVITIAFVTCRTFIIVAQSMNRLAEEEERVFTDRQRRIK